MHRYPNPNRKLLINKLQDLQMVDDKENIECFRDLQEYPKQGQQFGKNSVDRDRVNQQINQCQTISPFKGAQAVHQNTFLGKNQINHGDRVRISHKSMKSKYAPFGYKRDPLHQLSPSYCKKHALGPIVDMNSKQALATQHTTSAKQWVMKVFQPSAREQQLADKLQQMLSVESHKYRMHSSTPKIEQLNTELPLSHDDSNHMSHTLWRYLYEKSSISLSDETDSSANVNRLMKQLSDLIKRCKGEHDQYDIDSTSIEELLKIVIEVVSKGIEPARQKHRNELLMNKEGDSAEQSSIQQQLLSENSQSRKECVL